MRLRSILAGTALATIALVGAPQIGAPGFAPPAEAAVNVSFSLFYNQLGQYGDWVNYDNDYVFIPGRVNAGWRPYTDGHWVYAKRYGWTWASNEPFGWATYHYGRWGYADDIGWYWVPGKRWAPAWVSWRRSNDYVVWAPLPPSRHGGGADVSINVSVGDIPDYYWVAVPTRRFLAPDLQVDVVRDDRQMRQVVDRTQYIGTPRVTNNIVVNNVIDVNVIQRETGEKVKTVAVSTTDNPSEAKAGPDQVTAFQGQISADANAKPQKLTDVGKVHKIKRGQGGNDNGTAQQNTTSAPGNDNSAGTASTDTTNTGSTNTGNAGNGSQPATNEASAPDANGKMKRKKTDTGQNTAPSGTTTGQSAAPSNEASTPPADGKKKKVNTGQNTSPSGNATGQSGAPANEASTPPVNGKMKKKMDTGQNGNAGGNGQSDVQAQEQQQGKTHKRLPGAADQNGDATGSTSQAPAVNGQGKANGQKQSAPDGTANAPGDGQGKGKGRKNQACDPSTNASCAPAQ